MSELTEAEKRKILRERRQKKFSNGGASSRLNKITGQVDSQLSTESPLDTPRQSPSPINTEPVLNRQPTERKAVEGKIGEDGQLKMLKELADMQNNGESTPDLFSLLSKMKESAGEFPESEPLAPIDQSLLNYHDYLVNRLKAWTIVIKWVFFLLPYIYLVTRTEKECISIIPSSLHVLTQPSYFFMIFTSFEIVATSIYYQQLQNIEKENNINTLHNSSKIAKLASMIPEGIIPIPNIKGKIMLALQYWDVLSMFLTDICFVLVAMGIISYF